MADILKDILNLYNARRTYIFIYVKELKIQRYQYEAVAENADPQIEEVGDVGIEETPYLNNLIKSDLPFIVNRLDEIKDIAPGEYAILKPQRVNSLLIVPLISEKEPIGYIGLDIIDYYRTWSESDFQWLKSISSIITICSGINQKVANAKLEKEKALFRNQKLMEEIKDFKKMFTVVSDYAKVGYARYNSMSHLGFSLGAWESNLGIDYRCKEEAIHTITDHLENVHPQDRQILEEFYKMAKNNPDKPLQSCFEVRVFDKNTQDFKYIYCCIISGKSDDGINLEFTEVNYDIDTKIQAEILLRKAKQKAEENDRLKSEFLANMSHEIRTPLNAIVGFSSLLAITKEEDLLQEYLSIIYENNDLLLQIINDILDLSRIESGTLVFRSSYFDLRDAILNCASSSHIRNHVNIVLNFKLPPETERIVYSDKNRLMQVINNFIANAYKFTKEGEITIGYETDYNTVRVYVRDTGQGIDPEDIDQVFDRFVKLDSFAQGTGLGLSICKNIIERLNGKIGVKSVPGKGSEFWFSIPLLAD